MHKICTTISFLNQEKHDFYEVLYTYLFPSSCIVGTILTISHPSGLENQFDGLNLATGQHEQSETGRKVEGWEVGFNWQIKVFFRSCTHWPLDCYYRAAGSLSTMCFTSWKRGMTTIAKAAIAMIMDQTTLCHAMIYFSRPHPRFAEQQLSPAMELTSSLDGSPVFVWEINIVNTFTILLHFLGNKSDWKFLLWYGTYISNKQVTITNRHACYRR